MRGRRPGLPEREQRVALLLAKGYSTDAIAKELGTSRGIAGTLVKRVVDFMRMRSHVDAHDPSMLTAREAQVAGFLKAGSSDAEIAASIGISVRTVESHVANVLRKSGAGDRHQFAALSSRGRHSIHTRRGQRRLTAAAPKSHESAVPARSRPITARQRQVWALVAEGLSNEQIAARVGVGHRTIETHIATLRRKLGARNRTELAGRFTESEQ